MTKSFKPSNMIFWVVIFLCGCAYTDFSASQSLPVRNTDEQGEENTGVPAWLEDDVLALNPDTITWKDINGVLSHCPAPRIIDLDGSVPLVTMESFSKFLILMGYPEKSVRNPVNGAYTYSSYMSSKRLAGLIAWYYESEGMMPMVIGYSQGGMLSVKVLHEFAGAFHHSVAVWNPRLDRPEERYATRDPLTAAERPVLGLRVGYASAIATGNSMRILLGQWNMLSLLKEIPDTVEDFTGFHIKNDFIGSDFFGLVEAKRYHALGSARVRNVTLPAGYSHLRIPLTEELAKHADTREWINSYVPPAENSALTGKFQNESDNILFAADIWHSVKKCWCTELQRLIQARRDNRGHNLEGIRFHEYSFSLVSRRDIIPLV